MRVASSVFWAPKAGNAPTEYEDAYWPRLTREWESDTPRFAVSDGASEGMLSGVWANLLVRGFCGTLGPNAGLEHVVHAARRRWVRWQRLYLRHREAQGRPVQWYEEPGLAAGAFASLIGLTLGQTDEGTPWWQSTALGDSCLFHVRADSLLAAIPLQESQAFNDRPYLLGSEPARNRDLDTTQGTATGTWAVDDTFFLMTDALAHWALKEHEAGRPPWACLRDFGTAEQRVPFGDWLDALRADKAIKNDDVTLLRVDILSR